MAVKVVKSVPISARNETQNPSGDHRRVGFVPLNAAATVGGHCPLAARDSPLKRGSDCQRALPARRVGFAS